MKLRTKTENTAPLDRLLTTLERLRAGHEARQAAERKAREDDKLKRLRPWWLDAAQ